MAVGFGRLPTEATLGQPLRINIPIRLEPSEELGPDCLSAQVSFADNLQQPGTTSLRLLPATPGAVDRTLSLATTTRIDEPLVSVEITVGCQAKVTRRFTLFADPPTIEPAAPVVAAAPASDAASAAPARTARDSQYFVPITPAESTTPAPTASSVGDANAVPSEPRPRAPARAAAPPPKPVRPAMPRTGEAAAPKLKLAPLESGAKVAGPTKPPAVEVPASATAPVESSQAAAVAAAAAASEVAASAIAAEQAAKAQAAAAQAKVDELEATLKKLRAESASTQQTLAALQAKLARVDGGSFGGTLVWLLAALLAAALGVALWLWRQRVADREAQSWLVQAAAGSGDAAADVATEQPSAETAAFAPVPTLKAWVSKPNEVDGFDDTLALTRAGNLTTMPVPFGTSQPVPLEPVQPLAAEAQKREVSVEELIDLEQQAEFFVVLGQDSAAIDLLMGHLRSTAGTSPLPYLKLLEIYKRLGERDNYERLRERFNSRFNAYAPSWDTDLQGGRSLEEYPAVIERLQALWVTPSQAREVLQATLVRPENAPADPMGEDSFDLPAYRELMLLYSVIRDVSELEAGDGVDLMLPIGDPDEPVTDGVGHAAVFERLLATSTMAAQPDVLKPLEMDLTLDDIEPPLATPGHKGGSGTSADDGKKS